MRKKIIDFFIKSVYTLNGALKIIRRTKFNAKRSLPKTDRGSCYILGNGPSLTTDINACLKNPSNDLFAVNHFGLSELYHTLKPKYYIIADPGFYGGYTLDAEEQERVNNLLIALKETTSWSLTFFTPFAAQQMFKEILKENKNIKVIGYNKVNTWKGFKWFDRWVYNHQWAITSGQNVIMLALFIAIQIGYKKINLLGVDHSWHKEIVVGDDNRCYIHDTHFYENRVNPVPIYVEENKKIRYLKLHEQFEAIKKTFEAYHYIQDYAQYKKVIIYNCTNNSYIDAFERIKLN